MTERNPFATGYKRRRGHTPGSLLGRSVRKIDAHPSTRPLLRCLLYCCQSACRCALEGGALGQLEVVTHPPSADGTRAWCRQLLGAIIPVMARKCARREDTAMGQPKSRQDGPQLFHVNFHTVRNRPVFEVPAYRERAETELVAALHNWHIHCLAWTVMPTHVHMDGHADPCASGVADVSRYAAGTCHASPQRACCARSPRWCA